MSMRPPPDAETESLHAAAADSAPRRPCAQREHGAGSARASRRTSTCARRTPAGHRSTSVQSAPNAWDARPNTQAPIRHMPHPTTAYKRWLYLSGPMDDQIAAGTWHSYVHTVPSHPGTALLLPSWRAQRPANRRAAGAMGAACLDPEPPTLARHRGIAAHPHEMTDALPGRRQRSARSGAWRRRILKLVYLPTRSSCATKT